ncbi:OsmC family protein [Tropicimonas aquimaris]|uniref:OsmC family protein n=1 Tax=Tropicimonas aquimaris TaxID=914152 RepID=A0ABW3IV13_9RHOB
MAIRQKSQVTVRMRGTASSHSHVEVAVRDLTAEIDEPVERGGTNRGFSPTETAYAALIGCTNTIGHKCAEALGVDIGQLGFEMEVDFDRRGVLLQQEVAVPFTAIRLQVTADGPASAEELDRVAAETAKYCAISKLFEGAGTKLDIRWRRN